MFCIRCQNEIADCECDDIDERLAKLAEHPNIAAARCPNCDKHIDRCNCDNPGVEIR